jgi:hypothetical protein
MSENTSENMSACHMFKRANKANETKKTRFTDMLKTIGKLSDEGEYGTVFTEDECTPHLADKLRELKYKVAYEEGYCGGGYKDDDKYYVTWKNACNITTQANSNSGSSSNSGSCVIS